MKVYINRSPVNGPWGGGNAFFREFKKLIVENHGHELVDAGSLTVKPDVILLAGISAEGRDISVDQAVMYKDFLEQGYGQSIKLVLRVNENDARKKTNNIDKHLASVFKYMDGIVFVSDWLRDYFDPNGDVNKSTPTTVIKNGVDDTMFTPQPKMSNGKVNIVAHHWSDNRMKGFDIYEKIDSFVGENPDFTFTYIGRDLRTFKHTNVVHPMFGTRLGQELGKHDVYVSASLFDPGPNHVIEAISCGLPTYVHKDGGGCVEFAGNDHVFPDWDALKAILLSKKFVQNTTVFSSWSTCIQEYNRFLETVCGNTQVTSLSTNP